MCYSCRFHSRQQPHRKGRTALDHRIVLRIIPHTGVRPPGEKKRRKSRKQDNSKYKQPKLIGIVIPKHVRIMKSFKLVSLRVQWGLIVPGLLRILLAEWWQTSPSMACALMVLCQHAAHVPTVLGR